MAGREHGGVEGKEELGVPVPNGDRPQQRQHAATDLVERSIPLWDLPVVGVGLREGERNEVH